MDIQDAKVLLELNKETNISQRELAETIGISLGSVNKSIKRLQENCYLDKNLALTKHAKNYLDDRKPKNAIILAAGYGMRMVPINMETPKALLEVDGEPLIERLIKQLHEVGILEIYIVVGFMKEQFEYLIDNYGVSLIVNSEYSTRNNLHSLALASKYLSNTYVLPCDVWTNTNPFSENELYSWYMVSGLYSDESTVRVNRKNELVYSKESGGNQMIGISYFLNEDSELLKSKLVELDKDKKFSKSFWEDALYDKKIGKYLVNAKLVAPDEVVEINTYEQLRELDDNSNHLRTDAIDIASATLQVQPAELTDISVLKKGMTNRSFIFTCKDNRYIMRIPGEGTDKLINRAEEAGVYKAISNQKISDNVLYMNPENGYKITQYLENSRTCNPEDNRDLSRCMKKLRQLHEAKLTVDHTFDIFGQIEFYEKLMEGKSVYKDYEITKEHILELKTFIDTQPIEYCLTHIDAVPDNFMFTEDGDIRLIDWEYAGMQDPHVDIAMFCIYALYDRAQVDNLIDIYFENKCTEDTRTKIYCYIAICGLLWSNWCEYKRNLGVDFGEYSIRQYRYAKEYYKIAKERMENQFCIE